MENIISPELVRNYEMKRVMREDVKGVVADSRKGYPLKTLRRIGGGSQCNSSFSDSPM